MPGRARAGDVVMGMGTHYQDCCPHVLTGTFVAGSPNVDVNNRDAVRTVVDIFSHNCPHGHSFGYAIGGSSLVTSNNIGVCRVGDPVTFLCPSSSGNISSGSGNVIAA